MRRQEMHCPRLTHLQTPVCVCLARTILHSSRPRVIRDIGGIVTPRMSVIWFDFSRNAGQDGKWKISSELTNGLWSPERGHHVRQRFLPPALTSPGCHCSVFCSFVALLTPGNNLSVHWFSTVHPPTAVCLTAFSLYVPPCIQAQGLSQRRRSMNMDYIKDEVEGYW